MSTKSIVFVDSRISNYQSLIDSLTEPAQVFVLKADSDGLTQMVSALQGITGIDAIHVISHGSQGALYLGSTVLDSGNLSEYSAQLLSIGSSLTQTGDILLYGCTVAQGGRGQAFIAQLAQVTGADVTASSDTTGASWLGGNWLLEQSSGVIQSESLALVQYDGTLVDAIAGNTTSTQTLTIGSSAFSAIDYIGDTDWWKVDLVSGYRYQVWIEGYWEGRGTLYNPYLGVYSANGGFSFANDDVNSLNFYSYAYLTPISTGFIFLSAEESGNNATGTYTITIWLDELASTASAATVSVNSVSGIGHVGWQGDVSDWYGVTLLAGVQYQFDLIGAGGEGTSAGLTLVDPSLVLRNSSGTLISSDDDSGLEHNSRIFYTPSASGRYFLDAQEFGNDAAGTYRLIVNSSPAVAWLTLGIPQTGVIGFVGEVNLYSVTLTAGVTYAFSVDRNTLIDPYLEVLDGGGKTVGFDDNSGAGLDSYVTFTPTSSGTYFLAGREAGNNATGSYSVQAWQLPSVSIAGAHVTESNTGTTNLVFTLTLSAASPKTITVSAGTSETATATSAIDYIPTSDIVTFLAGQTSATFTVPVLGDYIFEPFESFHVLLSSPTNAVLGDSNANGYIVDNDNPYNLPTDSFVTGQWYLYPTTGINVFPVWNDYTGAGVRVAVFDQGIDPTHPEFNGNLLTSLGRNASNLSAGGSPVLSTDNHGTMVAGIIAAERNGVGVVGVAFGVNLISIYNGMTASEIANAFTYAANFDILNNSWGFAPQGTSYQTIYGNWAFTDNFSSTVFLSAGRALTSLAATGRQGLGTIVLQSAGNSFNLGDDTNLHNFQNSQYIITVAATDYFGKVTNYSSPGASILIAAPGGGNTDLLSDIITTDRVGAAGNNTSDYAITAGTSFSAPIVSGIVALMLDANPNLGYRDIQEILVYSARKIDSANNHWIYNGANNWNGGGLHYDALSHNLGYGLVDALAAVRLAETWSSFAHTAQNRQQITATHSPALVIPDNTGSGAYDSISVSQSIDVERVEVTLNVTHPFIGDLSVLLTSPSGTTSFLLWRPQQNSLSAFGTNQDNIHFTFDTVLDWGENSVGSWLLGIYDNATGDVGKLDSWTLNLIGKPASADDTYIYTDEFSAATAEQAWRSTLSDTGGTDTLNAAACTANLVLNLVPGSTSIIDERSLTIPAGTVIENVYGGDGNDVISGNIVANVLYGMRGNDNLIGGAGDDTLVGGEGADTLNGGDGIDQAVFSGNRANYTLIIIVNGYSVTDNVGTDGTDTVTDIETLVFANTTESVDTISPTVTTVTPADEATGIAIASDIVLTFSEAIVKGTGRIVLKTAVGATITTYDAASSANLSISGNTLTLNPTADLAYSTGYSVEFAPGTIKDLAGNSYGGTTGYNFTTAAFVNSLPTGSVTISGTITQNQTLSAANTLADIDGLGTIAYQWNADSVAISGAISNNLTLAEAQIGKAITVSANYTDGHGTKESVSSAPTAAVANIPPKPLKGTDASESLVGTPDNDNIDGGAGIDTVTLNGNRSSHTLTKTASGWRVSSSSGGTDTLQNVERLKFSDAAVALDIDGNGGQAYRVYQAAFNRTPDSGGLGFWISAMDGGASLRSVANGFVGSDEFKALYGTNPTNSQIVTKLYDNVLHRPGETGGFNFWLGVLDSKADTLAGVLAAFSESAENQAGLVGVIGNGFSYTPFG